MRTFLAAWGLLQAFSSRLNGEYRCERRERRWSAQFSCSEAIDRDLLKHACWDRVDQLCIDRFCEQTLPLSDVEKYNLPMS
jgi:hypothetical protein